MSNLTKKYEFLSKISNWFDEQNGLEQEARVKLVKQFYEDLKEEEQSKPIGGLVESATRLQKVDL